MVHSFTKSPCPFIANHDLLELAFSLNSKIVPVRHVLRRCYRLIDEAEFLRSFEQTILMVQSEFDSGSDSSNVDLFCASLSSAILEALDIHAPKRAFVVRKPPIRWLSADLRSRLRTRNLLYKRAKRSGCVLGYACYRGYRDQLDRDIKHAKSEFHASSLSNITEASKLWRELTRLGLVKSTLSSPFCFFSPSQLNDFYVLTSNAQPSCSFSLFVSTCERVSRPLSRSEFVFSEISSDQVSKILDSFPPFSFASGPDGIPVFILRMLQPNISSLLTSLFNLSLSSSHFPSDWRRSFIRPLSKIRTPLSPSDTRPIANLSEMSKILEKIVASQITEYLNKYNLLNPRQSAYRTGFNTQSALLRVSDDIRLGIDHGLVTIMIMFDFSKAFDTVPHCRLLCKLKEIGFSDSVLNWLFSYLSNRSQSVIDDLGVSSDWSNISSGYVPQGSVLGPLLFSLYINDINMALSHSNYMVFADDTQIYLSCSPSSILHGLELIASDATAIYNYALTNGLKLNLSKSMVMIFGSHAYLNSIIFSTLPPISINNVPLPFVSHARNLGVQFSSNLSWKKHIQHVSQKVHYALYRLKFNKNSLSTNLRVKLVTVLVLPHIDYCCLVYHDLGRVLDIRLQRLVNCCIRFIYDLGRDEHVTVYRRRLGWLSVENRRLYFLGCLVYRIVNLQSPSYLSELFVRLDSQLRRSDRLIGSQSIFHIPLHRTTTFRNSFHLTAIYFWHSLPVSITNASSLAMFKNLLRAHLLNSEVN